MASTPEIEAERLERTGQIREAAQLYESLIQENVDRADLYEKLHDLYNKLGLADEAMRIATMADAAFPDRAFPQLLLALSCRKLWDSERAASAIKTLLSRTDNLKSWVAVFAAEVLLNQGDWPEAEKILLVCLGRDSLYKPALFMLASLRIRQGAYQQALTYIDMIERNNCSLDERAKCIELMLDASDISGAKLKLSQLDTSANKDRQNDIITDKLKRLINDTEQSVSDFLTDTSLSSPTAEEPWYRQCQELNSLCRKLGIGRIVVWGFRSPLDHTHHWIHRAFYRAALEFSRRFSPDIEVIWADTLQPNTTVDDKTTLFISSGYYKGKLGHADQGLPNERRHYYLIHAPSKTSAQDYEWLAEEGRCLFFEEFRGSESRSSSWWHQYLKNDHRVIFPWATDLLPWECVYDRDFLSHMQGTQRESRDVCFVGSVWQLNFIETIETIEACAHRGFIFRQRGNFLDQKVTQNPLLKNLAGSYEFNRNPASIKENIKLVRGARYAPAYQGEKHLGRYIPCRILKNCSYGALGMTNNRVVADLLGDTILFENRIEEMFERAEVLSDTKKIDMIESSIEKVRNCHTYISRLHFMVSALAGSLS